MPNFKAGDIVICWTSKATDIKRKTYRVTPLPSIANKLVVENWKGTRTKISPYHLCAPEDYEKRLDLKINNAYIDEAQARRRRERQHSIKKKFLEQKHKINTLFPKI